MLVRIENRTRFGIEAENLLAGKIRDCRIHQVTRSVDDIYPPFEISQLQILYILWSDATFVHMKNKSWEPLNEAYPVWIQV